MRTKIVFAKYLNIPVANIGALKLSIMGVPDIWVHTKHPSLDIESLLSGHKSNKDSCL